MDDDTCDDDDSVLALTDQILRQGSSIFHSPSPLEEFQLISSVTQFCEPTTDPSSAASLTPIEICSRSGAIVSVSSAVSTTYVSLQLRNQLFKTSLCR
ncbi:hypothetical protein DY000_02008421 [Brassica cretica]|uniref:Uncharacterized protein n=1 Tax=Brassica cretica TaxID=69181 RepID=A0ABQ7BTS7_BRACR|nr:hypothetical protein DY000_02008421 [Brassica cretica]